MQRFHQKRRRLVGVGEAGGSPPAHAIISDYYPPHKRATALSIYSMGVYIGIFIGFLVGLDYGARQLIHYFSNSSGNKG